MAFGNNQTHAQREAGYCRGNSWGMCGRFTTVMDILRKIAPECDPNPEAEKIEQPKIVDTQRARLRSA